ncbi:hypothetical protein [Robbsia sp. KACC 23696]|uniref:BspC domain-containing protein n=1 Tax=Robbsia sp. KACC 23696 TaxID=3149231 RepID=UPI00325BA5AB
MSVVHSRQADTPFPASSRPSGARGASLSCARRMAAVAGPLACVAGLSGLLATSVDAAAAESRASTRSHPIVTHKAMKPSHSGKIAARRHETVEHENAHRHTASAAAHHPARESAGGDSAATSAAASKLPSGSLPVHDAVSICMASLNRDMRHNKRYDRLIQLDRYVIRARVQHDDAVFSPVQPVPVDTTVMINGSARVRGQWQWQSVVTRCGLHHGKVVATSIEPRTAPAPLPPGEERERRPGVNYVERTTPTRRA